MRVARQVEHALALFAAFHVNAERFARSIRFARRHESGDIYLPIRKAPLSAGTPSSLTRLLPSKEVQKRTHNARQRAKAAVEDGLGLPLGDKTLTARASRPETRT
jgi:hypothetical protein